MAKELEKEEWEAPERISLDEFSNLKGHKDFITTVVDLDKKIDPDIVHSSIANILRDYPRYQRSIVQYLDSLEAENG